MTAGAVSPAGLPAERVLEDVSFLRRELELKNTEQQVESGAAVL
jgi:hypothetical protein